jgi:hypothetical protein
MTCIFGNTVVTNSNIAVSKVDVDKYSYIHTFIHTDIHRPIFIHSYVHAYIHRPTYILHIYTHTYIRTYICTYIHIYIYTYIGLHTYLHTYTYTHIHRHTYVHTHTHTHTHTHRIPSFSFLRNVGCSLCLRILAASKNSVTIIARTPLLQPWIWYLLLRRCSKFLMFVCSVLGTWEAGNRKVTFLCRVTEFRIFRF